MANEEQLSILKQGVEVWNKWREENPDTKVDLSGADIMGEDLPKANLVGADLDEAILLATDLEKASLIGAKLFRADLGGTLLIGADLRRANLSRANLDGTFLWGASLMEAKLWETDIRRANLREANLDGVSLQDAIIRETDLSQVIGLDKVIHLGPSSISTNTFVLSKGKIPEIFLRGCGLSDWEIETVKLYNPDLNNEQVNSIQYRMYDLRATQALQISPLFISYSHADNAFVDIMENRLNTKGIRFWRDIHDMKSGRIEKQIDNAIRHNPTVLLVLSEHSLKSDWVEHEVRTARDLAKAVGRDVLCPVALDDTWKSSRWPERVMEQIMEYNILDFSDWKDDSKFDGTFRKLIDGLELFYKG